MEQRYIDPNDPGTVINMGVRAFRADWRVAFRAIWTEDLHLTYVAPINPEVIEVSVSPEWARHAIPGISGDGIQWVRTRSREVRLRFQYTQRAQIDSGNPMTPEMFNKFFHSLGYPLTFEGRPPNIALVWPGHMNFWGVAFDIRIGADRFTTGRGDPLSMFAELTLAELPYAGNYFLGQDISRWTSGSLRLEK